MRAPVMLALRRHLSTLTWLRAQIYPRLVSEALERVNGGRGRSTVPSLGLQKKGIVLPVPLETTHEELATSQAA